MKKPTPIFIVSVFLALFLFSCGSKEPVRVVEKTYSDGKENVVVYYSDDKDHIKLKEERFHPNGAIYWQGDFKNNLRDGYWRSWYQNGNIWSEGNYVDGKTDGVWKVYFENGKLRYTGSYKNGVQTGVWTFYDENGNKLNEEKY
jgi:antitoxin component YwqK of YwqJK toxin-antitoxin module